MEVYIQLKQNMAVQYIATWLLIDLCEAAERTQGVRVGMQWWEHAGIDLVGAR